jgi:hypothetical protein
MPTTIPLVSRDVNIGLVRGAASATLNADFILIAAFCVIGLALTVGFASLFPLSAQVAALMAAAS